LGEGYKQAGMKDKAIANLKKSLSLNPPAAVKANSLKLLKELGVEIAQ
jgi:tetratricopeptide (TPR) repeat protein